MSKKTYYITLIIGIVLGLATLVFAFLCEFGIAFILMLVTYAYSGCFVNDWRDTYFRGFEESSQNGSIE